MTGNQQTKTRPKPLYDMFDAIPRHYDLINHLITWGFDRKWRWQAARECLAAQPRKVLDLCCGTGDLALAMARMSGGGVELTGVDYSQHMLDVAGQKAVRLGVKNVSFTRAEADALPFPDNYFDSVGISFAFRNLTYKNPLAPRHIAELLRVLAPSGRCVIVESSQPPSGIIRRLAHIYQRGYVARIGQLISGNRGAYHYLAESAARYYTAEELKELLLAAGFRKVSYRRLFFGASAIHVAIK